MNQPKTMNASAYPSETGQKDLASGILKQAALDLRRFHGATSAVERELYLDAYDWVVSNDFAWPFSFLNVCGLLHLTPEILRTELLADAAVGPFTYAVRRSARMARALQGYFRRSFTTPRDSSVVDRIPLTVHAPIV